MSSVIAHRSGNDQAIRQRWLITGQVQGVGFRPFIYRLAQQFSLSGFVLNDTRGAVIEAQGSRDDLDSFVHAMLHEHPLLVKIQTCLNENIPIDLDSNRFEIRESHAAGPAAAQVTIDTALCPDCLREMLAAKDRRFHHALINCTNCGPRYSIIQHIPYDRVNTTMASFEMCPDCRAEYESPENRRFHAQPIACPHCGPRVQLVDVTGKNLAKENAIAAAVELLLQGKILAIKGLGGFHLAVRACDENAVARLRERKHRDVKPFALMFSSLDQIRRHVQISDAAAALLQSPVAPIVLAKRLENVAISERVAPGEITHRLGVMLPYTPLHHLIFAEGGDALGALVMTSGNDSDEPLAISHDDAITRLGPLCDAILWHDRPIARPIDDSIFIDLGSDAPPLPLRRARGMVPGFTHLPVPVSQQGLCVGGEMKNTLALVRDDQVLLSQHLGTLTHPLTLDNFRNTLRDMQNLFEITPQWIAHDLHPNYLSTHEAKKIAAKFHLPLIGVQHHHAHAAAVLAEHGHTQPALAIVCDGTGFGSDGSTWGGEFFIADLCDFQRIGSMRPLTLAGGDAAARDPRRSALALLQQVFGNDFHLHPAALKLGYGLDDLRMLAAMMQHVTAANSTTSMGRYFDGVASLLGLCHTNQFEAQAPMSLEAAAELATPRICEFDLFTLRHNPTNGHCDLDFSTFTKFVLHSPSRQWSVPQLAALFHEQLAAGWTAMAIHFAKRTGLKTVALSGGVFCNQRFSQQLTGKLSSEGLRVLRHEILPCNDGGLAYGQAAVAAARLAKRNSQACSCHQPQHLVTGS